MYLDKKSATFNMFGGGQKQGSLRVQSQNLDLAGVVINLWEPLDDARSECFRTH